jgi:hypothetical protein
MYFPKSLCHSLALAAALLLSCLHAQALVFRAYVASDGSDANPCTLPAPCRLLPAALNAVADGGEIWMLDSANYNSGPVNVTKSVTILAIPGAVGSVVAFGGAAIVAATPGVSLTLRNLVIVPIPAGMGTQGVDMTAGAALTVEGCLFANLPSDAISVSAAAAIVSISDTTIRGSPNGLALSGTVKANVARSTITRNTSSNIYFFNDSGAQGTLDVTNSVLSGAGYGLFAVAQNAGTVSRISVSNSQVVQNGAAGLNGSAQGPAVLTLLAAHNTITHSFAGLQIAGSGARAWASGNRISNNSHGLNAINLGVIESALNNAVRNNSLDDTAGAILNIGPM